MTLYCVIRSSGSKGSFPATAIGGWAGSYGAKGLWSTTKRSAASRGNTSYFPSAGTVSRSPAPIRIMGTRFIRICSGGKTLTGINQVWVADIAYIRILTGFVFLAAILDRYSRKVIGWAISKRIDAELGLAALKTALETRKPPPGCIHHCDRGVQYAPGGNISPCSKRPTCRSACREPPIPTTTPTWNRSLRR